MHILYIFAQMCVNMLFCWLMVFIHWLTTISGLEMDDLHALMSKNIIRPYLHLPHFHVSNDVFCTVVLSFYKVVVLALFSVVQLSFLELYIYIGVQHNRGIWWHLPCQSFVIAVLSSPLKMPQQITSISFLLHNSAQRRDKSLIFMTGLTLAMVSWLKNTC